MMNRHFLESMMLIRDCQTRRISSWDRSGGNRDWITIPPDKSSILAEINGPGCINHIYMTLLSFDRFLYRNLILRMYWDEENRPSVEVPLGDFFGIGHCKVRYFTSLLLCVNPGASLIGTDGLNCYFPMPFSQRVIIEISNESEFILHRLWYHIDYVKYKELDNNWGRFHAQWRRENPCRAILPPGINKLTPPQQTGDVGKNLTGQENYVILEAKGRGNYVGCVLNIDNIEGGWWGEGDDMIFIDGEKWPPSLHGTGTEEIFGGGACPNTEYSGPYTGFHLINNVNWDGKNSMYRFFVTDPINFSKSIKVTIEHGHANNLSNDYSSVAYWYQDEPHFDFPSLPSASERLPRLSEKAKEVVEKEKEIYRKVERKYGAEFWYKYPYEVIREVFALREKLNYTFETERYDEFSKHLNSLQKIIEG